MAKVRRLGPTPRGGSLASNQPDFVVKVAGNFEINSAKELGYEVGNDGQLMKDGKLLTFKLKQDAQKICDEVRLGKKA